MADEEEDPNKEAGWWFKWTVVGAILYVGAAFAIILFGGS